MQKLNLYQKKTCLTYLRFFFTLRQRILLTLTLLNMCQCTIIMLAHVLLSKYLHLGLHYRWPADAHFIFLLKLKYILKYIQEIRISLSKYEVLYRLYSSQSSALNHVLNKASVHDIDPPLLVLCVLGVYTKGTILPVRPDRRLHSRDRCQRLLLPTARHPACAGYILWHLRAQCTLTLPGQSAFVPACVSARYCVVCLVVYMLSQAQTIN